ncbi:Antiviral helicase ski2 [Bonamia ostreae]|uniref:Antiviral helicase ski2 n=1 Tax=Bonamia ostreae TaxID=126728 RepID=A0ABV2AUW6_9EUKA
MMVGIPNRLTSKFRVTFNMILNLLKSEGANVKDVIKKSFDQSDAQLLIPKQLLSLKENKDKLEILKMEKENEMTFEMEEYFKFLVRQRSLLTKLVQYSLMSNNAAKEFAPGLLNCQKF